MAYEDKQEGLAEKTEGALHQLKSALMLIHESNTARRCAQIATGRNCNSEAQRDRLKAARKRKAEKKHKEVAERVYRKTEADNIKDALARRREKRQIAQT